jgi:ketosteroid isomerase-like protein
METGRIPSAEELATRLAIHDTLATHSRGVDRSDAATLKSCYWPDAEVAYGGFNGPAWTFCDSLPEAIAYFSATQHTLSNVLIELDGDRARVETYVTASHYRRGSTGPGHEMTVFARYLDVFERRGDCWKIRHRRVVMDWNRNAAAAVRESGPPFDGLARGGRYPDDPLRAHLDGRDG